MKKPRLCDKYIRRGDDRLYTIAQLREKGRISYCDDEKKVLVRYWNGHREWYDRVTALWGQQKQYRTGVDRDYGQYGTRG